MRRGPRIFHLVSYLQYPLVLAAVVSMAVALPKGEDGRLAGLNLALVFLGLSISFATLQDTSTTQNELSRRVWSDPAKGRFALLLLAAMTLTFIVVGLVGVLGGLPPKLEGIAFGVLSLGIGMVGMVKAAGEMFEHHRSDRLDRPD